MALPILANLHIGINRSWFINFDTTLGYLIVAKANITAVEFDVKDKLDNIFDIKLGIEKVINSIYSTLQKFIYNIKVIMGL